MGQGGGGGDTGQLGAAAPAEGPAGGGEHQTAHLGAASDHRAGQPLFVTATGQGLSNSTVLGVHRHHLAGVAQGVADQGAAHHQGLLVGQRQARPAGQGGQGGQEPHRPGNAVQNGVASAHAGGLDEVGGRRRAGENVAHGVGAPQGGASAGQGGAQILLGPRPGRGYAHHGHLETDGLLSQEFQAGAARNQARHPWSPPIPVEALNDLQGLGANGAGGPEQDHGGGRETRLAHRSRSLLVHSTDRRTSTTRAR